MLAAAWELRRGRLVNLEQFKHHTQLTQSQAQFVYQHVLEDGKTHDEFIRLLRDKQVA